MLRRSVVITMMAASLAGAQTGAAADPCAATAEDRVRAFLAFPQAGSRDSAGDVEVALCLLPARGGDAIASYRGELRFDSSTVRVTKVERGGGGMRIENGSKAGRLLFAGASPNGFRQHLVLRAALVSQAGRAGALPPIQLVVHELTAVDGRDLSAGAHIAGYSDSKTTSAPMPRRQTSRAH